MRRPRFVIVNTCDVPQRNHIAEWKPRIGYCYMARTEDPLLKRYDGMKPKRPTPIEQFGFDVFVGRREVIFRKTRESVATYEDGKHRDWQDRHASIPNCFYLPLVGRVKL